MSIEHLVPRAAVGEKAALNEIIDAIRDRIYGMSIRMLGNPEDAEEATQEILIRIITHLGSFRAESRFMTWAYRIATNHLLNTRQSSAERLGRTFERFGADIERGVAASLHFSAVQVDRVLRNEIRLSCTHSMLLCLSRDERMAFILGGIFELSSDEASTLLDIPPATFRKRLSRARERLQTFMRAQCGVFDANNACRCDKQGKIARGSGQLMPEQHRFVPLSIEGGGLAADEAREFTDLLDVAKVIGTQPSYATPTRIVELLDQIINQPA
ncbi:MAG: RNA polymerase sigma factor (sigma-70 family) [Myxococcota bacterium]|jgi:RNA polymerase sigma factor (sigma-70 family)